MNIKLYPQKLLVSVWGKMGDNYKRGFKPDQVSAIFVRFFCQEREQYHPSLKDQPNKGLFIMGQKGLGKTINFFVYRKIQARYGERGMMIIGVKELETKFKINGEATIYEMVHATELMIDDLGAETAVLKDYGTDRNLVYDILMQRYERFQRGECITHATTNLNIDMLKERYDSRLIDRMKEMFILKKVTGDSKR